MKPLIALYKVYRGGEWMLASLESIAAHIQGIVIVEATRPFTGVEEPDFPANCGPAIEEFCRRHPMMPVRRLVYDTRAQEKSYDIGLFNLRLAFGDNVNVLIIDNDEVWDGPDLEAVLTLGQTLLGVDAIRARPLAYLRSPLYRVEPPESQDSVVFLFSPVQKKNRRPFWDASVCALRCHLPSFFLGPQGRARDRPQVRLDRFSGAGKAQSRLADDGLAQAARGPQFASGHWRRESLGLYRSH